MSGLDPYGKGDPLARYYTPDALADLIVARRLDGWQSTISAVIDPHVGGGAFARAAGRYRDLHPDRQGLAIVGYDIDPGAPGFHDVDCADVRDVLSAGFDIDPLRSLNGVLIVGNPPFSSGKQALQHVEAALHAGASMVAFILPAEYIGHWKFTAVMFDRVAGMALRHVEPILPRPWPSRVRETALYTWRRSEGPIPWSRFGPPLVWTPPKQPTRGAT
jgi:hypothetical protein